jgi:hypothetical protein
MSYILSENLDLVNIYNLCVRKCIKWDDSRTLCDTLRQKKMCSYVQNKIIMLIEEKKKSVESVDDCENIEPQSKKVLITLNIMT